MEEFSKQSNSIQMQNPALYEMMSKMIADMRFNAYFTMIYGVLACITLIGAIIGVPMFISGLRLRDSADEYKQYLYTGDIAAIFKGFENQKTYFFIQKVFIIVGLVFFVLYIGAIIVLIASGEFLDALDRY